VAGEQGPQREICQVYGELSRPVSERAH